MNETTRVFVKAIADEIAKNAVNETLLRLGLDPTNALEAQKDMAALREMRALLDSCEFRQDLLHLRKWRKSTEAIEGKGYAAAISMMAIGGIAAVAYAIKIKFFGI